MKPASALASLAWLLPVWALSACGGTLNAGSDEAADDEPVMPDPDVFPLGPDSPVIVNNDGPIDNWLGEYAVLLAQAGLDLRGIVINDSIVWDELDSNVSGWQSMLDAALDSGLQGLPPITSSSGPPLVRPSSGEIDDTVPNNSEGAQLIIEQALSLDVEDQPLALVAGGRLTDMADAYLVAPEIADRVVVIASLGDLEGEGALMGIPNGEMDPWSNEIVIERLRYVQVSSRYDQKQSVTSERLSDLPANPFGEWLSEKSSGIWEAIAADQVALLTVSTPGFAQQVERAQHDGTATLDFGDTPRLALGTEGDDWLVSSVDGELATQTLWDLLQEVF